MSFDPSPGALSAEQRELLALLLEEEGLEPEGEAGIPRRPEGVDLPLSYPQQRLWFLQQLEGGAAYNVPLTVQLEGALFPAALGGALSGIVRRHESLRTSFALVSGQPVQRVAPAEPLAVPLIDLSALAPAAALVEAHRFGTEEIHRPFDLAQAPLLRATLVRLAGRTHLLFLVLHHIASDLWSRGVLLRELSVLYQAALEGAGSPLPALPIQYPDFALWQRREVERILEPQLAYWKERLAGVAPLDLPTDRPRGAALEARGRREPLWLSADLSDGLTELARRESKTLFMTLLAGFLVLLHRHTGQEDVAVGTPVIHRKRVETEGLIGLFLNTLVLRTDLGGAPSFRELLARVQEVTVGAYAHDDLPFEKLVEELQPERSLDRTPLFQVVFSLGTAEAGRFDLAGVAARPFPLEDRTAKFEMNLTLGPGPSGLSGPLEHRAELFDRTTIRRLLGHLTGLLAAAVADPGRRIDELPLLSAAESHQLLVEWNDTAEAYAPIEPLHRLIERQVARTPDAVAVVFEEGHLSYAGLCARANGLARELRALGVGAGTVVGLSVERSVEMMVGLLAVLKAGGAYLPVDPDYPEERRAFLLADAAVPVLLTGERLAACRAPAADLADPADLPGGAGLDDMAYVIYTSGSTGKPKGVQVTHRGIVNRLHWMQQAYGLADGDRVMQKTPFSFDVSVWELFWPLLTGACLVMARPGGHRLPSYLVDLMRREEITTLHFVPSMLRLFLEEPGIESCTSLRRVFCSGEALPADLPLRWMERSAAGLHNLYGPTEASVDVTYQPCRPDDRPPVPIGRPVANTAIHLLDRGLRPVPVGVAGELHIGGVQLARAYLGRPALTAERFIPDPFGTPGGRLYKTGDLARHRPDGTVEYLGRLDHQVKVRGFRIEPGEIDAALGQHPAVAEVAVVPWEGPPGHVRLVAYLVPRPEQELAAPELRAFLLETLPEHMVPSFFVVLDALPLSPNGKLDRRALPAPGEAAAGPGEADDLPQTPAEEVLAAIWSQVTGVERVGVHDNFFVLGGDSIRSLQVVGLARERGLALTLQEVFQFQTVAELARQAEVVSRADEAPGTAAFSLLSAADRARLPAGLEDAYPLTAMQTGMLFHMALQPDDPPYHNVDSWHLEAPFAAGPLQEAFDRVTARHAVMRTSYDLSSFDEPLQLVHPQAHLRLEVEDLLAMPAAEQERVIGEYVATEKRRLFSHGDVPQLRCRVHRRTAETFQLTLTENHAVWDGWSLHATLAELFDLYAALRRGEDPPPAAPVPVEFRDFVALERRTLESAEAREVWREVLDGCEPLTLPAWPMPESPPPGRRIRVVRLPLADAVEAGVRRLARTAVVPLKSVFLAAHLRALSLASGQSDVLCGIISNGRPEVPGGDQVRGLFLNTLPIRLQIEPGSWADLARDAFELERRILPYRRYPLIALRRERGGEPLFEVVFNYIHFYVVDRAVESGGIRALSFQGAEGTSFLLEAHFFPAGPGGRMTVDLEYDSARMPVAQAEALGRLYGAVLEAMAADPEALHDVVPEVDGLPLPAPQAAPRTRPRARPEDGRARPRPFTAPRTAQEETLAAIWRQVLRQEKVGVEDDFFALGGDSILAIRIVARAARAGLRIDPRDLFEHPTLARLAAAAVPCAVADEAPVPAPAGSGTEESFPLSPLQEGMLLYHLLHPGSGAYFGQAVSPLPPGVDPAPVRRAWELSVERHSILRTRFVWESLEAPRQVVERRVELPWREEDWRAVPEAELRGRLGALLAGERRSLDLSRAPVLRFVLLRLGEETWQLAATWHHIVLDGWSLELLAREQEEMLPALARGGRPALPPAAPFHAYLDWLARQSTAAAEQFWRDRLAGLAGPTPLPGELAPAAAEPAGAARQRRDLAGEESAAIQSFARRSGLTAGTLVAAAWSVLLGRFAGLEDVVFGMVSSGRPADLPGVESMAGVFLATVPVRLGLPSTAPTQPWLLALQAALLADRRHEFLPLAEIQRCSPVPASRPLFESLVVVQPQRADAGEAVAGRVIRSRDPEAHALSLFAVPAARLSLRCSYDPGRFEDALIARLLGHLATVLSALGESPERHLADLPLLTAGERQQLLAEWNPPEEGEPGSCFPELFARQAARTPDAVAAVCGGRQITYAALHRASGALAGHLCAAGVGPEDVVALLGARSLDFLVAVLGVLRAGAAWLPLDPSHPPHRWARVLGQSGCRLVLVDAARREALAEALGASAPASGLRMAPLTAPGGGAAGPPPSRAVPNGLAYVIFTSGSTGIPKGAMVEHRGMLNHLAAKLGELDLAAGDVVAQTASQCFDISVWQFLAALLVGGRVAILEDRDVHDPRRLAAEVAARQVTLLETVPSLLRLFLEEIQGSGLTSLRWLIPTGEALPPDLCRVWLERFPEIPLLNAYGPTECSDDVSHQRIAVPPAPELPRVPIGRPLAGLRLYVVDRETRALPVGLPGELCVAGIGVGRGYLGDPARTAERFVPDPFSPRPGGRLYRTGDRARHLPGGALDFLGRFDHQIKLHGYRIELGEVEAALAQLPGVAAAAATLREDRPGEPRLVGYVVAQGDLAPAGEALRERLRERLPEAMIPSAFVVLDEMPLTPNGKLDRAALPAPENRAAPPSRPRTELEAVLAGIWSDVLGREQMGTDESFFDLGGHSVLAIRVTSRLRAAFGVDLPLRLLFENPTVATLARQLAVALGGGREEAAPPLQAVPRTAPLRLSFAQQRLWFLDQLEPGSAAYNMPMSFRLRRDLNVPALQGALAAVVRRHEVLRTRYRVAGDEPRQVIDPPQPIRLPVVDLSGLPPAACSGEEARLARAEAERPFDLAQGPVLRCRLLRLESAHFLLATFHHIASDGESLRLFGREVRTVYEALAAGRPADLPELAIQYADFAAWQRGWLTGEVLERHVGFWRARLAGAPPQLDLPLDRPRPQERAGRGRRISFPLPGELSAPARRSGATLFMAGLAVFRALLARLAGQQDVVVGSPVSGRDRLELEPLIGFFVNTLALRGDLSGAPSFLDLLARARRDVLEAHAWQDLPFERLVEELQPPRSLGRPPLFQVLLLVEAGIGRAGAEPGERSAAAKFDLTLSMRETEQGMAAAIEYMTDVLDRTTVLRWAGHLATLQAGLVAAPETPFTELPLLDAAEQEQILSLWSGGTVAAPEGPELLQDRFLEQARRRPAATALVWGEERWSYGRLARESGRLARRLGALGVGPEVAVGVCLERSPLLVVALLGVLRAGGAYVPVDPLYPAERQAFQLADSGAALVLRRENLSALLEGAESDTAAEGFTEAGGAGHLAYVIYTSGSTGRPKGVAIEHRSAACLVSWALQLFPAEDLAGVLAATSVCFDLSVFELFVPLSAGGTVVLAENALALASLPAAREVRLVNTVPSACAELLRLGALPATVRTVCLAGEALPRELADRVHDAGVERLFNLYGPTEDTTYSTWAAIPLGPQAPAIGKPLPGTAVYVLDDAGLPVPAGVCGELHLAGAGLARGYLGRPERTAERFVPDPFGGDPGGRLYRTGDRVRFRPDGELEFLGRLDHQVKVRGFRIEPGEVEAALLRLPGVREAAVLARDQSLLAFVASEGEPNALRQALRPHLPDHMIPSSVVVLGSLPRTPNGKVDRAALTALGAAGPSHRAQGIAPRGPGEEVVSAIWAELLRVDRVGVEDDFFELGGHSLLATRVLTRVRQIFRVDLPVRSIFDQATVAGLVERLAGLWGGREIVDEIARTYQEFQNLSEEEIRQLQEEEGR